MPERVLAGVLGASQERASRAVGRALTPEGDAVSWYAEGIALGATGAAIDAAAGLPGCLIDGDVEGLDGESQLGLEYGRRGEEVLGGLRGHFAVVLWDPARGAGCVARDPLGGRPLYLSRSGNRVMFASEIRVLLRMLPTQPDVDRVAVATWLGRGGHPPGRTLYEGVSALEPGCLLSFSQPSAIRRYWQPRFSEREPIAAEEATGRVIEALDGAVGRALGDNGNTGVMLSGGLDSTTVASCAMSVLGRRGLPAPRAYTAVFPRHPDVDESSLSERVASELQLPWTRAGVHGGSALAAGLDYQRAWAMPAPSPNRFFDQPLLRRAAADGVGVVLDGQGGDELFGASPFLVADRLRTGQARAAVDLARDLAGEHAPRGQVVARILARYGLRGLLPSGLHQWWRRQRDPRRYVPAWFTREAAELMLAGHDDWAWKRLDGPRWWAWLAYTLTAGRERGGVATHLGREAATAGLRSQHPLLDLGLVEAVLRCPPHLAFDRRTDRPLLRKAMEGRVPEAVRLRVDKAQFNAIQNDALALTDGAVVQSLVGDPRALVNAYVDPSLVKKGPLARMRRHRQGENGGWTMPVWRLLTLECWLRGLEDPGFAEEALATWNLEPPDISVASQEPA